MLEHMPAAHVTAPVLIVMLTTVKTVLTVSVVATEYKAVHAPDAVELLSNALGPDNAMIYWYVIPPAVYEYVTDEITRKLKTMSRDNNIVRADGWQPTHLRWILIESSLGHNCSVWWRSQSPGLNSGFA